MCTSVIVVGVSTKSACRSKKCVCVGGLKLSLNHLVPPALGSVAKNVCVCECVCVL